MPPLAECQVLRWQFGVRWRLICDCRLGGVGGCYRCNPSSGRGSGIAGRGTQLAPALDQRQLDVLHMHRPRIACLAQYRLHLLKQRAVDVGDVLRVLDPESLKAQRSGRTLA